MFSSGCNHGKLKTTLNLCSTRLEYMQKKKEEISVKRRSEVANILRDNKIEHAKIRVEEIIRDDYLIEAMSTLQLYTTMLCGRFGLIQDSKTIHPTMEKQIATLLWCTSRLKDLIPELKTLYEEFRRKYGEVYVKECTQGGKYVDTSIIAKLDLVVPPDYLVKKYLEEIAKSYNVDYNPNKSSGLNVVSADTLLVDFESESSSLPSLPVLPQNINFDVPRHNNDHSFYPTDEKSGSKSGSPYPTDEKSGSKSGLPYPIDENSGIQPPLPNQPSSSDAYAPPPYTSNSTNKYPEVPPAETSDESKPDCTDFESLEERFARLKGKK